MAAPQPQPAGAAAAAAADRSSSHSARGFQMAAMTCLAKRQGQPARRAPRAPSQNRVAQRG
eukprot:9396896-Alexandrium_andersonii.AAC.1